MDFGTLLLPGMLFSERGETVLPSMAMDSFTDLVFTGFVGNHRMEFYKDGYIKIESRTKEEAVERLNCFVLCFRLLRHSNRFLPHFREQELSTLRKNPLWRASSRDDDQALEEVEEGEVVVTDYGPRYIIDHMDYTSYRAVFMANPELRKALTPFRNVNAEELKIAIDLSDKVFCSRLRTQLLTLGEAWSVRNEADVNTSFILSWICIESMLYSQMKMTYGDNSIYRKNSNGEVKLSRSGRPIAIPAERIIQKLRDGLEDGTLSFSHGEPPIQDHFLDSIDKIRDIRNDIVHGNRRATKQELEECFGMLHTAMWRLLRIADIHDYNDYLNRMRQATQHPSEDSEKNA